MKKWTFQKRLLLLAAANFLIILMLGGLATYDVKLLSADLTRATNVDIPLIRTATLVDMLHDGLRSIVYQAAFAYKTEDRVGILAARKDFEKWQSDFKSDFEILNALDLEAALKAELSSSHEQMKKYRDSASIFLTKLDSSELNLKTSLAAFDEEFEALEKKLGDFGDLVQSVATDHGKTSQIQSNQLSLITNILAFAGAIFGIFLSFLIGRSLVSALTLSVSGLRSTSLEMTDVSSAVAKSSEELSASSNEQAAAAQETAASMEEITSMVTKTSDNVQQLTEASKENRSSAQAAKESALAMSKSIRLLREGNEGVLSHIEETNQKIREISNVIAAIDSKTKIINDIVFQTKILAFNASVEAARAGENGKGFAVVAEEVGNLAQMSGAASKEITDILETATRTVNQIVDQSKAKAGEISTEAVRRLEDSELSVNECDQALDVIVGRAQDMSSFIQEISSAISEQAKGITEINQALNIFNQTTQTNNSLAKVGDENSKSLTRATQNLSELAADIASLVEKRRS